MSDATTTTASTGVLIISNGRGIWVAPKVAPYVNNFNEQAAMTKKMKEVFTSGPGDQSMVGGQLDYKGHIFREYKVGSADRFFAWWYNGNLVVFAIGTHRGNSYEGMTFDNKSSFPVKYDNYAYFQKGNEAKLVVLDKDIGELIKVLWPFAMNSMNAGSPYGAIYD